jgi:hypothetical protein
MKDHQKSNIGIGILMLRTGGPGELFQPVVLKFLVSSFPADGSPEEKPPRRKTRLSEHIIRIYNRCHPIDKREFLANCIYFLRVLFSLEHVGEGVAWGV